MLTVFQGPIHRVPKHDFGHGNPAFLNSRATLNSGAGGGNCRSSTAWRSIRALGLFIALWTAVGIPLVAQEADPILTDRLVAVVDDDPIFLSDLSQARGLARAAGAPWSVDTDDRSLLDQLIDRRLRLHAVERGGVEPVPAGDVDEQVEQVERRIGGADELDALLARWRMDRPALRLMLSRRLKVLAYVEERLAARVFIDEGSVRAYYSTTLSQEMERRDAPLPAFEQVAEGIRLVLEQEALNREIEVWTDELRAQVKIEDFLDRTVVPEDFPPVVRRIE